MYVCIYVVCMYYISMKECMCGDYMNKDRMVRIS